MPLDKVASFSALVLSPTFFSFLFAPLLDVGITRKAWAFLLLALAGMLLGTALFAFDIRHITLFAWLVLLSELCIMLYFSACAGWIAEFLPDHYRGTVSGWMSAANLGGGALAAMGICSLTDILSARVLGITVSLICVLPGFLLLYFPNAKNPDLRISEAFKVAKSLLLRASAMKNFKVGLILFLAPASSVAAINLFSGLGNDFGLSPRKTIWITGTGCAAAAALGSVLCGYILNKSDRVRIYLSCGLFAALCSFAMAFAPQKPITFAVGVLAYNFVAGAAYASFNALSLALVSDNIDSASSQLGVFSAASNLAIVYMTWLDGMGYRYFSAPGLLVVDASASVLAVVTVSYLRTRFLVQKGKRAQPFLNAG